MNGAKVRDAQTLQFIQAYNEISGIPIQYTYITITMVVSFKVRDITPDPPVIVYNPPPLPDSEQCKNRSCDSDPSKFCFTCNLDCESNPTGEKSCNIIHLGGGKRQNLPWGNNEDDDCEVTPTISID